MNGKAEILQACLRSFYFLNKQVHRTSILFLNIALHTVFLTFTLIGRKNECTAHNLMLIQVLITEPQKKKYRKFNELISCPRQRG